MNRDNDLTIERTREVRHSISEQCGHNPQEVVDYYLELQKKYQSRTLTTEYGEAPEVNRPTSLLTLSAETT